jgi:hypothetical protein
MNKYTKIAVVVGSLFSSSVFSAAWVADARGNAMGNTGVTTANFVLAPFYNPALTAVYRDKDTFGILFPAINASARDPDDSLSIIDDTQSLIDDFNKEVGNSNYANVDPEIVSDINSKLDDLNNNEELAVSVGLGAAVALPVQTLSVNLFSRGYAELLIDSTEGSYATGSNDAETLQNRVNNTQVDLLAFTYIETGLSFAKLVSLNHQNIAFGISPKIQRLATYKQVVTVEDFDIEDYDQSKTTKNAFNLDLGAVWLYDHIRAGVAVKDLFKKEIDTYDNLDSYTLSPQVTVSGGYVTDYFTAAIDVDLTKQERFSTSEDDTQFIRLGLEGNAWGWAQLRAGYEIDSAGSLDNNITAGIGISPYDVVSLDITGSYAGENQYGAAASLEFTF